MTSFLPSFPAAASSCAIMSLLNAGNAFKSSMLSLCAQVTNEINSVINTIKNIPGMVAGQAAAFEAQLLGIASGAITSLEAHVASQISGLINNLSMAVGHLAAQTGLAGTGGGCSFPSNTSNPQNSPCFNMSKFFGSIIGAGEALLNQILSQLGNIVSSLTASAISTIIGTISGIASQITSMISSEVAALSAMVNELLGFANISALLGLVSNPCAQQVLSAVGTPNLTNALGLTTAAPVSIFAATTLNADDISNALTLTNENLEVTYTGNGDSWQSVRATEALTVGEVIYFEVIATSIQGNGTDPASSGFVVGAMIQDADLSHFIGNFSQAFAFSVNSTTEVDYVTNTVSGSIPVITMVTTGTYGFCFDLNMNLAWIRDSNTWYGPSGPSITNAVQDPGSYAGGWDISAFTNDSMYPTISLYAAGQQATTNFSGPFAYPVPNTVTLQSTTGNSVLTSATLDPTEAAESLTLSNGNLTCTYTSSNTGWQSVLSTEPVTSGNLVYFEFTATNIGSGNYIVGAMLSTVSLNYYAGQSMGIGFSTGVTSSFVRNGNYTTIPGLNITTGSIYGICIDANNNLIWIRDAVTWYGSTTTPAPNPSTTTSGWDISGFAGLSLFPTVSQYYTGQQTTINFSGPFIYSAPTQTSQQNLYVGATTTLNPADIASNLTITNTNNLDLMYTGVGGTWQSVRATDSFTSGEIIYFEVNAVSVQGNGTSPNNSTGFVIGAMPSSVDLGQYTGETTSVSFSSGLPTNFVLNGNVTPTTGLIIQTGNVYGVCIDLINNKIWIHDELDWYGSTGISTIALPQDPDTNSGGWDISVLAGLALFPTISLFYAGQQAKVKFIGPFKYGQPKVSTQGFR